jgi:hypothetical protein
MIMVWNRMSVIGSRTGRSLFQEMTVGVEVICMTMVSVCGDAMAMTHTCITQTSEKIPDRMI